ncbi:M20 aminoacylase family protein [Halomonas caseinilytica]|uniref:Hippurate hydrolase n=1 Tax=Halomonas caseinilytica TaxID=438744 RepID=A0A1M6WNA7_9GAMM|nr:M20 aminoacylase family protein [Halomonas caseinilytica]SEM86645.1 hippurate hydrolase [Halomonas caseinilytica]SHK95015.1 hippurate hydrolase [Halomonas caseinilytica]
MEKNLVEVNLDKLVSFRRDVHRHPELGFEEHETSRKIREYLEALDVEYVSGIGKTGIVAWIVGSREGHGASVGLRADMDALPLEEHSGVDHASRHHGRMHACGHDGHTTMLLGAVEYFRHNRAFSGTIYFIFQPAEEGVGGGKAMVDDGLFERFPIKEVYGLHNWPGLPVGKFGLVSGPIMASGDRVDITIQGRGGHGGLNPHGCVDPIRIAAELISKAHTIISREVDPLNPAVLSICAIQGGDLDGFAVIPNTTKLSGTIRALDEETRTIVASGLRRLCESLEHYYGATIELKIEDKFGVTFNDAEATESARKVIQECFGEDALVRDYKPSMGGEDFSYMLAVRPGSYIHVGSGDEDHPHGLHNPQYDFNDSIIPLGVSLLSRLAVASLNRQYS